MMDRTLAAYRQLLGLPGDVVFSLIAHEDALVATVYKVTLSIGSPLILKICESPHHYRREKYFLSYLADQLPVPKIIQTIDPEDHLHGAILMECYSGTILNKADLTEALAFEAGLLLGRLHLNRTPLYGDLVQEESLTDDPQIPYTQKFEESLSECKLHLPETLIDKCQRYFDDNCGLLKAVDGPCIVHRDFRPGNLMAADGKLQGIIDWSSARAGFAEEDFCLLENEEWSCQPILRASFLEGYASMRPIPNYQVLMPLLRLNKAVATIGFTVKRGTWENSSAVLYALHRRFLDDFFRNS